MTRRTLLNLWPISLLPGLTTPQTRVKPHAAPTMQQLINLAESHPREIGRVYYGKLLAKALREAGRIANVNSNGSVSLYWAEEVNGNIGWIKETVRSSLELVPNNLITHFRPENRGLGFPGGVPYKPL